MSQFLADLLDPKSVAFLGASNNIMTMGTGQVYALKSRFTGRKRSIYQTEANRIDYYHDITAGTTDYSEMRVYRRPKK